MGGWGGLWWLPSSIEGCELRGPRLQAPKDTGWTPRVSTGPVQSEAPKAWPAFQSPGAGPPERRDSSLLSHGEDECVADCGTCFSASSLPCCPQATPWCSEISLGPGEGSGAP